MKPSESVRVIEYDRSEEEDILSAREEFEKLKKQSVRLVSKVDRIQSQIAALDTFNRS